MKARNIFLIWLFSWAQIFAEPSEEKVIEGFREYIGYYNATLDGGETSFQNLQHSKEQLIEYGEQGVDILLEQLIAPKPGIYKEEIIQFFIDSPSLNHEKILPAVRNLLRAEKTNNLYPSTIVNSMGYLAVHGGREDIPLIERFSSNPVSGVKEGVKSVIQAIKIRVGDESVDNSPSSPKQKIDDESKGSMVTPEPTFAKKSSSPIKRPAQAEPTKNEQNSDNPFPYWIFIIGGVVVVGLVVVLKRK